MIRTLLGVIIAASIAVYAGTTGGISGTISDSAGAAVTGAEVTVTNTAQGVKSKAHSDKKGLYGFLTLTAGSYNMHVEAKGFKPLDRPGVVVHVNSAIKLDLMLEPE